MSAPDVAGFDPGEILRALEAHHVRYIVIDAMAAIAAGAPVMTTDLDITADRVRENLERLARALDDLQARLRSSRDPEGVAFPADADMLESADSWTLLTRAGNLDVVFSPAGTRGYADLRRNATRERIAGVAAPVASLADVIRCKEAAGRPKDLMQLRILRQTLEEIRAQERRER